MIKKVNLGNDQSIELNGSFGWLLVYRAQFGHDILPDLMPALEGILGACVKILGAGEGKAFPKTMNEIVASLDEDALTDMWINLAGLEFTTILQIVWSMAKKADPEIEPIEEYFDQFESISLDTLLPAVFRLIIESSVSSKKAKSLLTMMNMTEKKIRSKSRKSSSPESKEG